MSGTIIIMLVPGAVAFGEPPPFVSPIIATAVWIVVFTAFGQVAPRT